MIWSLTTINICIIYLHLRTSKQVLAVYISNVSHTGYVEFQSIFLEIESHKSRASNQSTGRRIPLYKTIAGCTYRSARWASCYYLCRLYAVCCISNCLRRCGLAALDATQP